MSLINKAAVLYGPLDLRVEDVPMPEISDDEVLIKVEAVGICGSDVKLYSSGKCGFDTLTEPLVIGHEGAGVVIQVGSKVKTHAVGDRVAIEPTNPCRTCQYCKWGQYNLCPQPSYCSSMGTGGNLCRYYKHIADFCHIIPDHLTLDEAAAVQPLAIAIHACQRARIKLGAKLAIFGAGPIGMLCAMASRAMGATDILITDVVESRLKTAKELIADHTLVVKKDHSEEDTVNQIVSLLGDYPDVCIDACGYESVQRVAMKAVRSGGVCLIVGIGGDSANVPLSPTVLREVDIIGSYRFSNTYPMAISSVASGIIDLKPFITHHYPLSEAKEAVELCRRGEGMKVIIHTHQ